MSQTGIRKNVEGLRIAGIDGADKLGFFNHTPITAPASAGTQALSFTANEVSASTTALTIADGSSATNDELLQLSVNLTSKLNSVIASLENYGLVDDS